MDCHLLTTDDDTFRCLSDPICEGIFQNYPVLLAPALDGSPSLVSMYSSIRIVAAEALSSSYLFLISEVSKVVDVYMFLAHARMFFVTHGTATFEY